MIRCSRCQHENSAGQKFRGECGARLDPDPTETRVRRRAKPAKGKVQRVRSPTRRSPKAEDARLRDLEKRLAEALEQQAAPPRSEVAVSDTAVGIEPEDQEAVFEEFRQVGMADKKIEGTGLGLALCRRFAELHGGRIWVKSQVGQGSTFNSTLPIRREVLR